ncbi:MAG: hypothetical protein JSV70_03530 [bacterium]|nr:MAG: hypothetical protein JSV70_03530 [bacterium]
MIVLAAVFLLPARPGGGDTDWKGRIILYSYGPARIQITAPDGSRAGADLKTGEYIEEIKGSGVRVEKAKGRSDGQTVLLEAAGQGVYRLDLAGTGTGRVVVDLEIVDAAGGVSRNHVLRRVKVGDLLRYALDYNPAPGSLNRIEEVPD